MHAHLAAHLTTIVVAPQVSTPLHMITVAAAAKARTLIPKLLIQKKVARRHVDLQSNGDLNSSNLIRSQQNNGDHPTHINLTNRSRTHAALLPPTHHTLHTREHRIQNKTST